MKTRCTKGWFDRCSHAESRRCTCACGGANHGREASGLGTIRRMFGGVAMLKIEKILKGWADHNEIGWIKQQLS